MEWCVNRKQTLHGNVSHSGDRAGWLEDVESSASLSDPQLLVDGLDTVKVVV